MGKRDIIRKVWISHFLPYGIIGNKSLIVGQVIRPYATERFAECYSDSGSGMSMKARERACALDGNNGQTAIRLLRNAGYVTERKYRYDSRRNDIFTANYLTRSGLFVLTGTLSEEEELKRNKFAQEHLNPDGSDTRCYSLRPSKAMIDDVIRLNELVFQDGLDREQTKDALYYAIETWMVTPLAADIFTSLSVQEDPEIKQRQLYRAYCENTIISLFRAANFLTCLDRRPIETGWNFTCEQDEDAKPPNDIPAYVSRALTKWYTDNPDSYLFCDPAKSLFQNREEWLRTPAFYAMRELPDFEPTFDWEGPKISGQKNTLRHTFTGVAIGTRVAYICYNIHSKTNWNPGSESTSQKLVSAALQKVEIDGTHPYENINCNHAIFFFESITRFKTLFHGTGWKKKLSRLIGIPYQSAFLIQISNAGVAQLKELMYSTPYDLQKKYIRELLEHDSRFEETSDRLYPVAFNGTPVYIAYLLDYSELRTVYSDYLKERKFCICCYPEQATALRSIMPNVEYI